MLQAAAAVAAFQQRRRPQQQLQQQVALAAARYSLAEIQNVTVPYWQRVTLRERKSDGKW